ncbi:prolyl oligopeptidase family protein [Nonomuraea sp. NPDC050328]|uniref:prolyl oligopeptidase family protein n=1 Tax=Nonomuraea sp. NPDC050328 TaxID=3364361 RepID=UPI0037A8A611
MSTAPRLDLTEDLHGVQVADPYRWLEDPDAPETREWLDRQEELFAAHAEATAGVHARFAARLAELERTGYVGPPAWRGGRRFVIRRAPEADRLALHVVDPDGTDRVLLAPARNETIDLWQPSDDGTLLAYELSTGGTEQSLLYVLDVATGTVLDGPIDGTRYSPIAWLPEGKSFYYVRRIGDGPRRVYLHHVGADADSDALVFGEGRDAATHYRLDVRHGWLTISAALGTSPANDLWLADLRQAPAESPALRPVQVGVDAHTALRVGPDGRAYVLTDLDAPRGRIAVTDPARPGTEHWRDLVPEDPEAVLADFVLLDGELVVNRTRQCLAELTRHDPATGELVGLVPTPGQGTVAGLAVRPEGGREVWFAYTDYTTPVSVFRFDAETGRTTLWEAPPGHADLPAVGGTTEEYTSRDGTRVQLTVLGAPGPRPFILFGYGGFGLSMVPAYNPVALAWIEAGGGYAIARIRGGGERGEQWRRAGMLAGKQNVFDDFLAAAEHLIATGRTTADRLAITGGSNGGLLVGAALTQRPDLFAAAVSSSALLDMVRYERSGLGPAWTSEYGTAADPEHFRHLLAYSPYHRVEAGVRYPATLLTVAEADTRVDPAHARKMGAALQWASPNEVLLRVERAAGHGTRAVTTNVQLNADILTFCSKHTKLL